MHVPPGVTIERSSWHERLVRSTSNLNVKRASAVLPPLHAPGMRVKSLTTCSSASTGLPLTGNSFQILRPHDSSEDTKQQGCHQIGIGELVPDDLTGNEESRLTQMSKSINVHHRIPNENTNVNKQAGPEQYLSRGSKQTQSQLEAAGCIHCRGCLADKLEGSLPSEDCENVALGSTLVNNEVLSGNQLALSLSAYISRPTILERKKNYAGREALSFLPGIIRIGATGLCSLLTWRSEPRVSPCSSVQPQEHGTQPSTPPYIYGSRRRHGFKRSAMARITPTFPREECCCNEGADVPSSSDEQAHLAPSGCTDYTGDDTQLRQSPQRRRVRRCESKGEFNTTSVTSDRGYVESQEIPYQTLAGEAKIFTSNVLDPSSWSHESTEIGPKVTMPSPLQKQYTWPLPLDDEPHPDSWGLGEGESEVLASAERIGSILVRVVTWNLHAKPVPEAEELRKTLLPREKFHIFAFGTEECLNSIAKSVIIHSKKEWESRLKETLGESYEMLCGHSLQATHNAVFAHRGILPLLRNVRSFAVATGLGLGTRGVTLGNKGGVGIAFDVGATTCVFVNSHLAAHQRNVAERNEHFVQIQHGLIQALAPQDPGLNQIGRSPPRLGSAASTNSKLGHDWTGRDSRDTEEAGSPREFIIGTDGFEDENIPCRPRRQFIDDIGIQSNEAPRAQELQENMTLPSSLGIKEKPTTMGVKSTVPLSDNEVCSTGNPPCPRRADVLRYRSDKDSWERARTLPEMFDRVVWAGDLNYRVNVTRSMADQLLTMGMHEVLLQNEQLTIERRRGGAWSALAGYQEGPLNFRPTYKFDSGTDAYDTSSKQRIPAWTDRVLYASGYTKGPDEVAGLDLRAYRSVAELNISDHRPVLASFVMRFDRRKRDCEEGVSTNQTSSEVENELGLVVISHIFSEMFATAVKKNAEVARTMIVCEELYPKARTRAPADVREDDQELCVADPE